MNRMNSALHTDDDAPLEKAIKFAKVENQKSHFLAFYFQSNLILQRTVMARGLVEIAHDIGYEDFVVHLLPRESVERKKSQDAEFSLLWLPQSLKSA